MNTFNIKLFILWSLSLFNYSSNISFSFIWLEFEKIQTEQPLSSPPKPPQERNWRGSVVAPFSGNNMLVLFQCPGNNSRSEYYVQVLHNEVPVPMPVRFVDILLTFFRTIVSFPSFYYFFFFLKFSLQVSKYDSRTS